MQEALRRHVDAAFALDRLDEDGCRLRTYKLLRGLEVAERRVDEATQHRAEALLQGGLSCRAQAAVGAAVEGLGEGQGLVFLRAVVGISVLAGELDRSLHALGAGVAEEDLVEVRGSGE